MASINAEGFIISPQDFSGAYKLADTLNQQRAEREKEKARIAANKKLLGAAVEDIDPKDFMTNTLEDGVITSKIYDLKDKLNKFIVENPQIDQATLNSMIAQKVRGIATASQNIKQLKVNADNKWNEIKTLPGADQGKFYSEFNRAFKNPDGTVREDIENIDPTIDYADIVYKNGDIWTSQAIHGNLEKLPTSTTSNKYTVSDGKTKRTADLELTYNPIMFQPKKDEQGVFGGFQASTDYVKQGDELVLDKNGKPIEILGQPAYDYFMDKPETAGYINQRRREIAKEQNLNPNDAQVENLLRHELWKEVSNSPQQKTAYKESKGNITYISTGKDGSGKGAGGGEEVRDIHTPAFNLYNDMQGKKDKAIEMVGQGKSDEEIGKALGIDSKSSLISNARKGIKKYSMPLNTVGLDSEFVNSIIENVNKGQSENRKKFRKDLYVELNDKNQWEAKDTEGNLVATVPATTLGWKIQPGAKEKRTLAQEEKQKTKGKTSRTYKSYDGKTYTYQQLIKAGYTDAQIQQAIQQGNLKEK